MTFSELQEKYPDKEFGRISIKRRCSDYVDEGWVFYQPKWNNSWLIGGTIEATQFHKDLGEAIEFVRNNP